MKFRTLLSDNMSDDEEDFAPDFIDEEPPPSGDDAEQESDAEGAEEEEEGLPSEDETDAEPDVGSDLDPDVEEEDLGELTDAVSDAETLEAPEAKSSSQVRVVTSVKGQPARAEKPKVDPLIHLSNTPRITKIIHPDDRRTSNVLQKSEAAHILGKRATQIADSPTVFVDISGLHDPVAIAFKELIERRCPLIVRRVVAVDAKANCVIVEDWNPNEMAHPQLTPPTTLSGIR